MRARCFISLPSTYSFRNSAAPTRVNRGFETVPDGQLFVKRPLSLKASRSGPAGPPVLVSIGIRMTVSPMKALSIGQRHPTSNIGTRRHGTTTSRLRSTDWNCLFASCSALSRRSASSPHQKWLVIGRKGDLTSTLMSPSGSLSANSRGWSLRPSGRGSIRSFRGPAKYQAARHSLKRSGSCRRRSL